jgi:hypothetical protein
MSDAERFANAIRALAASYRQECTAPMLQGYRLGLAGISVDAIERATAAALQRCKFMPVPAELRALATTDGLGLEAMAVEAFAALRQAIQDHGPDYSVQFADGAITAAVRHLGGWQRVCEMPREEFDKWFSKEFHNAYLGIVQSGASADAMRPLIGNLDRDNAKWDGQVNPRTGQVFRLANYGGGVHEIGVSYQPALPAPEPEARPALTGESFGLNLKGTNGQPLSTPRKALPSPGADA